MKRRDGKERKNELEEERGTEADTGKRAPHIYMRDANSFED